MQGNRKPDGHVPGEPDLKPYKVERVNQDGEFVSREGEYATEAEAIAHKRRPDWRYRITFRRRQIWPATQR